MDPTAIDVMELLEQLDDEVDDLEEALAPILKAGLAGTASKLPLLDKAKLYVLVTYAVESLLFSYLRLNGVNAREHPVFQELTRVKQYFDKIKVAENPVGPPTVRLDTGAAGRFIKAGLSGNDRFDAERLARSKAKVNMKFAELGIETEPKKVAPVTRPAVSSDSSSESSSEEEEEKEEPKVVAMTATQKAKKRKEQVLASRSATTSKEGTPTGESSNAARKKKKANKRKATAAAQKAAKKK